MNMSSITNIICIYSQNVWKNYVLVDSLLESWKDLYDILFIQEPPWNFIQFAPLLGAVHTRVEVHRMDSEMSRLVE